MPTRRRIVAGMVYTIDEENDDTIELEIPERRSDPPLAELQGEPMGWSKGAPYPRGYAALYDNSNYQNRDDPGPFDGRWESDK